MHPKWVHKFELKPGKWVYHPSPDAISTGIEIKKSVSEKWTAPRNYFHLRPGGHVEALRYHLGSSFFLHLDIKDFFGSVNRSRITRCLKPRFGYKRAREMANSSTVQHPKIKGRYILPYGFVQSSLLASLAFCESALGRYIQEIERESALLVSVYVDDIVVSGSDPAALERVKVEISSIAERSKFQFNELKSEGPSSKISAFNIELTNSILRIQDERLHEFRRVFFNTKNSHQKNGINSYIWSVNSSQVLND